MSWDNGCAHQGCRYPRRKESETCNVLGRAWVEGSGRRVTYIVPAIIPDLPFANQILEGSVSIVDCCVSGRDEPDWSLQGGWFEARDDSLISSSSTTDMIHFFWSGKLLRACRARRHYLFGKWKSKRGCTVTSCQGQ